LALVFAAVDAAAELAQQALLPALLLATGAIVEPRAAALGRSDRRARRAVRPSVMPG